MKQCVTCGLALCLAVIAICARLPVDAAERGSAATPKKHQRPSKERVTLVGYNLPWETTSSQIWLAGAWSPSRGWIKPPEGDAKAPWPTQWRARSWHLFCGIAAGDRIVRTRPVPEQTEDGDYYVLTAPAPLGVATSRTLRPLPRRARRQHPSRPELRTSTRGLLARHGIPVPARPRILESVRVDLNGDGLEEVLWTARSRDGWNCPYKEDLLGGPKPNDYALLGIRFVTDRGVCSETLAIAAAGDDCNWYRLFTPLDINGDGRLEILAHQQGFEEDTLLAFTFDGNRITGVLGTTAPSDPLQGAPAGAARDPR
jgi:hypothetical protein